MISLLSSDFLKGNFLILAGTVLLLHTLGLTWKVIYFSMLFSSVLMIFWGFVRAGYFTKLVELMKSKEESH